MQQALLLRSAGHKRAMRLLPRLRDSMDGCNVNVNVKCPTCAVKVCKTAIKQTSHALAAESTIEAGELDSDASNN